ETPGQLIATALSGGKSLVSARRWTFPRAFLTSPESEAAPYMTWGTIGAAPTMVRTARRSPTFLRVYGTARLFSARPALPREEVAGVQSFLNQAGRLVAGFHRTMLVTYLMCRWLRPCTSAT